ncbi:MAG: glycosyl hydrolase family protein [Gammaproteobacteria bacterium]|nr:MAG: glycosyl hydrolase family protein [Gammaproteobacteria bacterium]
MINNKSIYFLLASLCVGIFCSSSVIAKPYKGAEIYSAEPAKYGRYVMRMRMAKGSGLLSTFFTYKNGSEVSGALWEEIDIEVLGKNDAYQMQSNIIVGSPRQTTEVLHTASQSLADDYHTYTLEWTPDYVAWFIDGQQVRKINGGNFVTSLVNSQTMRFNIWASTSESWVGAFNASVLPVYQFVNYMEYYAYNASNKNFTLAWRDDFNNFDTNRWAKADWTFDGNYVDFDPANVVIKDGTLVLALTTENAKGFSGTVPVDGNTSSQSSSAASTSRSSSSRSNSSLALSSSSTASSRSSIASSSTASSNSNGEQCNWYGTLYPLCSNTSNGWGYENNKSCISRSTCSAQPAPFGVIGTSASSAVSSSAASSNQSSAIPQSSSSIKSSTQSSSSKSSASSVASSVNSSGLNCTAKVVNNWSNGYQLDVVISNGGAATVNGWNVTLTFSENPQRTGGWNATISGSGNLVTASNLNWNGTVAPSQSVSFGLQGNHDGSFVAPTCKVN